MGVALGVVTCPLGHMLHEPHVQTWPTRFLRSGKNDMTYIVVVRWPSPLHPLLDFTAGVLGIESNRKHQPVNVAWDYVFVA